MANAVGVQNGARGVILRALRVAGDGFVTDRLLRALTGIRAEGTLGTHIFYLRKAGHIITRVTDHSGGGWRLTPPAVPLAQAAE